MNQVDLLLREVVGETGMDAGFVEHGLVKQVMGHYTIGFEMEDGKLFAMVRVYGPVVKRGRG